MGKHLSTGRALSIDGPFVPIRAELLRSDAWRTLSINARRLLDFLMAEHLSHAGLENGNLLAPYAQLEAHGIGRRLIGKAIEEAESKGLVMVERRPRKSFTEAYPLRFRLTFIQHQHRNDIGTKYWVPPTDEWRHYREPAADSKNRIRCYEGEPDRCTKVHSGKSGKPQKSAISQSSPSCTLAPEKMAEIGQNSDLPIVHEGEPLSRSWEGEGSKSPTSANSPQAKPETLETDEADVINLRRPRHQKRPPEADPHQVDLEDLLGGRREQNPIADLRHRLRVWLESAPPGEAARIAEKLGVTPAALVNWRAGRDGLNHGALRMLDQILRKAVAS